MGVTGRGVSVVQTFAKWVDEERRRMPAATEMGEVPLTAAARAEPTRFPKLVAEQDKDLAFLKKQQRTCVMNAIKGLWLISRLRCCIRDGGRSSTVALQDGAANHCKVCRQTAGG